MERVPAVRHSHAAGHLPHVHLPQETAAPTQEEEEEEKAESGRPVQWRRRPQGEEQQQQDPDGHFVHGLWQGHQRYYSVIQLEEADLGSAFIRLERPSELVF